MNVVAGKTNLLPSVIWMPYLNPQIIQIASPRVCDKIVTHPQNPGLKLRIAAGMVIRDSQGKIVTQLSMTAAPVNQPPFPLPHIQVSVYFTIQPGGAQIKGGVTWVS